jgi:tetratricopeptide (TPR) repeat protein
MRLACSLVLPGLLLAPPCQAQIGSPPEFQSAGAFQASPTASSLDGTSHIAAERTQINETLIQLLRAVPTATAGVKLIDNRLLREAELHFRKNGPPEGLAVILFLTGETDASAELLCHLDHPRALPLLGETVGAAPTWAKRILTRIETLAATLPPSADSEFYWARALLQQFPEQTAAALPHLERAATLDGKGTRALLELGRLYAGRQQNAEAIHAFERALARDPSLAMAHYRLAALYRSAGDPTNSARHLQEYQRLKGSAPAR